MTYVYIPPQAPGPGHACRTTSKRCSSVILPTVKAPSNPFALIKPTKNHDHQTTQLTVRFKRVRDIDWIAFLVSHRRAVDMSLADLYRTAIHDDRRAVVSYRGYRTAWHILVTSRQGYVAIVVLGLGGEKGEGNRVSTWPEILFSSSYQCDLYSTQSE